MQYLDKVDWSPYSTYFYPNVCSQKGITLTDKEQIIKLLYRGVEEAHKLNIIIGDLSGENVFARKGGLKFIDVDSYIVPGVNNSNYVQQPEIRDHQRGLIDKESDYWACAILVFQLLTRVHPFKGTYKPVRGLRL